MMAGLEAASAGTIEHNGKQVLKPEPSRAVVYQTMALFPWMTVKQNVGFSQKIRRADKKQREADTQRFIDMVGLTGFENSYPVQLSGCLLYTSTAVQQPMKFQAAFRKQLCQHLAVKVIEIENPDLASKIFHILNHLSLIHILQMWQM